MTEQAAFLQRTRSMPSGCVEWIGPRDDNGYGRFTYKRNQQLAHRAAWRLFCGELPAHLCVLHRCDNPPCVNPAHLFLGDRGDNARDMVAKGRQWLQTNPDRRAETLTCPPERKARGSSHGNALLTEAQVLAIRQRASRGDLGKHLAAEFHCSTSLISAIVRGQAWQHVGGPIKTSSQRKESS